MWGQRIKQLLVANGVAVVRRPAAGSRTIANRIAPRAPPLYRDPPVRVSQLAR